MSLPWYRKLFSSQHVANDRSAEEASMVDAEAQFGMGLKYALSPGAAQNYNEAALWYRKAAEQNHPLAQFNLGMMFSKGQGVGKDDIQAALWFEKAANQGVAAAQHNLGVKQHRASFDAAPSSALESRIEAYKWFQLAAAQGYIGSAALCAHVTRAMTFEEVKEGENRIAAFVALPREV